MTPKAIKERLTGNDRAVSPVIGVILMVAITVILAAVNGTFVLDLGQSAGNSAPSASLNVVADTGSGNLTISHKGGDGLDAQQTRLVVTNESTGNTTTFLPAGSADVLSVGGEVDVGISAQPDEIPGSSSSWTAMSNDAGTEIKSVKSGYQYTVQLIDTESQRVIYETTITA